MADGSLLYPQQAQSKSKRMNRKFKRGFGTTVREVSSWIVPRTATAADILQKPGAALCVVWQDIDWLDGDPFAVEVAREPVVCVDVQTLRVVRGGLHWASLGLLHVACGKRQQGGTDQREDSERVCSTAGRESQQVLRLSHHGCVLVLDSPRFAGSSFPQPGSDVAAVVVETPVTRRPPHRSQRTLLTHWALASGSDVKSLAGPGMQDTRGGEPLCRELVHSLLVQAVALASSSERAEPVAFYLGCPCSRRTRFRTAG